MTPDYGSSDEVREQHGKDVWCDKCHSVKTAEPHVCNNEVEKGKRANLP